METLYFTWEEGPAVLKPVGDADFGYFITPEGADWTLATPNQVADFFVDGAKMSKVAFEKAFGRKLTRDELFEVIKEGKLTEAEDYKYKKYVAKAFKDILGAQFDFRHAMGVKQLTNKDMKLKKKADAIYKAIIDLQKDMKSKGLTENKLLK